MSYTEATVMVDGAVYEEATLTDDTLIDEWVDRVRREAESDGLPTLIYFLFHDHHPDDDPDGEGCQCIQFLPDLRPAHSWNEAV